MTQCCSKKIGMKKKKKKKARKIGKRKSNGRGSVVKYGSLRR